ncbi:hypothetical protein DEO72_LG8g2272 [Vigna unguiculata]|uniref:Uncharacterized protein n=1 Tax=Vigna unguiculata TaxID=3917 RepID=A0A4D6MS10_VIGUN|nr:hypothetical protein DEO72_LG8g2270 [Vigna unguiculata]QCE04238.1 hypothetical protein DEO72_LG8g2272 [Vigna unguiculata]
MRKRLHQVSVLLPPNIDSAESGNMEYSPDRSQVPLAQARKSSLGERLSRSGERDRDLAQASPARLGEASHRNRDPKIRRKKGELRKLKFNLRVRMDRTAWGGGSVVISGDIAVAERMKTRFRN